MSKAQYTKKWVQRQNLPEDIIRCQICDKPLKSLGSHLRKHNINVKIYRERYPLAPTVSKKTSELQSSIKKEAIAKMSAEEKERIKERLSRYVHTSKKYFKGRDIRAGFSQIKKIIPEDKLYEMYWTKEMSLETIANELKLHRESVRRLMKIYNIPRRTRSRASKIAQKIKKCEMCGNRIYLGTFRILPKSPENLNDFKVYYFCSVKCESLFWSSEKGKNLSISILKDFLNKDEKNRKVI
jgi:ribosomal protein L24E